MDFSKKVLLASCLSAAFLAGVAGCMIEDRNIEEKMLFVCKTQDDCLSGSQCIKPKQDAPEGKCVRDEDVNHCHDYDGDGFYAADDGYDQECGFTEENPQDADDSDADINPKASEKCDGKDNNQDGCINGTCSNPDGCHKPENKKYCERLYRPCVGDFTLAGIMDARKAAAEINIKMVCDPVYIGGNFCKTVTDDKGKLSGEWKYGLYTPDFEASTYDKNGDVQYAEDEESKTVTIDSPNKKGASSKCPSDTDVGYVAIEANVPDLKGNGYDEDCDGKDETAQKCEVTKESYCYVEPGKTTTQPAATIGIMENNFHKLSTIETCETSIEACRCIGKMDCLKETGSPVCQKGGQEFTVAYMKENCIAKTQTSAPDPTPDPDPTPGPNP